MTTANNANIKRIDKNGFFHIENNCGDEAIVPEHGLSDYQIATNGLRIKPDETGRLTDCEGRFGYHTRISGIYVCYTCGHLCECGEG
jgi:hypothetical protein